MSNSNNLLHFLYGKGNFVNHHQYAASTWMMQRQPYCARTPTTHQLIGGVMKPIFIYGNDWEAIMMDKSKWANLWDF